MPRTFGPMAAQVGVVVVGVTAGPSSVSGVGLAPRRTALTSSRSLAVMILWFLSPLSGIQAVGA
jgi:hypothetical protein